MYEKSLSITICLFPYKRFKNFSIFVCSSFTGTDQPVENKTYKTFRDTIMCHHAQIDGHAHTYKHTYIHR